MAFYWYPVSIGAVAAASLTQEVAQRQDALLGQRAVHVLANESPVNGHASRLFNIPENWGMSPKVQKTHIKT